jgi:hypothetical protein
VIEPIAGGVVITIHVIPRAAKSGLAGRRGDALLVRLNAPPVEGAANAELIAIIATSLQVSRQAVSIVSGQRSRQKRIRVEGIDVGTATGRLGI